MAAQILDGKKLANESEKEIFESVSLLKEKGIISQEEFEKAKSKLLNS